MKSILISGDTGFVGKNLTKYLREQMPEMRLVFLCREESRDQRPDTRDQKLDSRDQRPETRERKPETRGQRPESGNHGLGSLGEILRTEYGKDGNNQEIYWDDIQYGLPGDIDVIIHLAGKAHDLKKVSKPEAYFEVNTQLTEKLYGAFLRSNASKFIFLSSVKASADDVDGVLLEDTISNPKTVYGKSKLAAEEGILRMLGEFRNQKPEARSQRPEARDQKPEARSQSPEARKKSNEAEVQKSELENDNIEGKEDLNHMQPNNSGLWSLASGFSTKQTYIIRPCMIHGAGNKGNLNLLYQLVSKHIPWPLGAFENKRSFCSIDNLLFVIKELVDREIASGVYNMADDEALSTNDVIGLIAEAKGRKPLIWKLPVGLMNGLAKLGDKLNLPLNTERLQKLTESYVVSNDKIKLAIGSSLPVSSRKGLLKTFASFKKYVK